ncbi:MAG: nuclear transport factor 2 family protein [Gemmatimonadetes bacterium]|nr:nuclear transport factor 2 family protein [Gemmatimonadota bacterium]
MALAVLACLVAAPGVAAGQTDEEAAVRAAVDRLFDAMRAGDSTAARSVFHPEARLVATQEVDGEVVVRTIPADAFVEAIGRPREATWDERIRNVEIRVDDRLATAWMEYVFFLGDELGHCGVNAFQLSKTADGWKVTQIADTRRQVGCEVPDPE